LENEEEIIARDGKGEKEKIMALNTDA